jgi:hypothetical protein
MIVRLKVKRSSIAAHSRVSVKVFAARDPIGCAHSLGMAHGTALVTSHHRADSPTAAGAPETFDVPGAVMCAFVPRLFDSHGASHLWPEVTWWP